MFNKTDIQCSSEVGHTNLHKKMISKIVKKKVILAKIKLREAMMVLVFFTDPVSLDTLAEIYKQMYSK